MYLSLQKIYQKSTPLFLRRIIFRLRLLFLNSFKYGIYKYELDDYEKSYCTFKEKKGLFIHIPKCAGISFYYGLYDRDSHGHLKYSEYQKRFNLKKIFSFTVVRHPVDRLYSAYHYLKKGGRDTVLDYRYQNILKDCSSFEEFVLEWLSKDDIRNLQHFKTQSYYLKDKNGQISLDYIGKFEDLNDAFVHIAQKINTGKKTITLPSLNKSIRNKKIYISKEVYDKIYEHYVEDFIMLDYANDYSIYQTNS